jgi:hypothetical protein
MAKHTDNHHVARLAAIAAGESTFMGDRCKAGHDGLRYAKTHICIACCAERNAKRCTGRKPGRPKAARIPPKAQPHRIVQVKKPKALSIVKTLHEAMADYRGSVQARENSNHLDHLVRQAIKVPHDHDRKAQRSS